MMAPINDICTTKLKNLLDFIFLPTFAGTFRMFVGHDRFLIYTVLNSELNNELDFCDVHWYK